MNEREEQEILDLQQRAGSVWSLARMLRTALEYRTNTGQANRIGPECTWGDDLTAAQGVAEQIEKTAEALASDLDPRRIELVGEGKREPIHA